MSLASFLSVLSKRDPRLQINFGKATEEALDALRKDAPVGSDVHVSTVLGEKPKAGKKPKENPEESEDSSAHLPVTNMTLAAQQITGQAKQTAKFGKPLTLENIIADTETRQTNKGGIKGPIQSYIGDGEQKFWDTVTLPPFARPAAKTDDRTVQTTKFAEVLKVDDSLGLVLGWAIVCKKDGCDYFDLQEDHIPETSMLSAAVDFMQNSRVAKEMHVGDASGVVLFAFPLTEDIAKAFGIETKTTGLMIAMKPDDDATLAKFRNGELTGFSIGGHRIHDEDVAA